jgi:hypothetical protein
MLMKRRENIPPKRRGGGSLQKYMPQLILMWAHFLEGYKKRANCLGGRDITCPVENIFHSRATNGSQDTSDFLYVLRG